MERRQEKKIGGEDIFYILTLFLGSTTIQWLRKSFLNLNEMVASPRQGVKMYKSLFGRYVHYSVFLGVVVKSIIGCLNCDFDESIIWCFESWVVGKRDGCD